MSINHRSLIFCIWFAAPFFGNAQQVGSKIKTFKSSDVTYATVDRLGNFFIVSKKQQIKKFDPQGKRMATLKTKNVTLVEPWYHPTIFVYDQLQQKYWNYGRYFENPKENVVDASWAIQPTLVCPSNDNKLWVFDATDMSIKKINPHSNEVLREFSINSSNENGVQNFTHLREYQNMIFLLDEQSGISIYSHIGKKIRQININELRNFNFFGEELYYLDGTKIKFFDLVTGDVREMEVGSNNKFALVTDEAILLVTLQNRVILYRFNPN